MGSTVGHMRRAGVAAAAAVAMTMTMVTPASAATDTVQIKNFRFDPVAVAGVAGDSVTWQKPADTFHNVASSTGMFRSGDPNFGALTFTRTFSAGTYSYLCEVHADEGMRGTVRNRPRVTAAPSGAPFTVRWATSATNTGTSFGVHYRINSGDWRVWRRGTTTFAGIFGANDTPVRVVAGRTYRFRVRSILSGNTSGFSPLSTFTP